MRIILYYLLIMNVYSFILMGADKRKARKKKWRIKEKTFFRLALFGGALGIFLAMKTFRHKTLHKQFKYGIPVLMFLNASVLIYLLSDLVNQ